VTDEIKGDRSASASAKEKDKRGKPDPPCALRVKIRYKKTFFLASNKPHLKNQAPALRSTATRQEDSSEGRAVGRRDTRHGATRRYCVGVRCHFNVQGSSYVIPIRVALTRQLP
jgi:hypothetical protein